MTQTAENSEPILYLILLHNAPTQTLRLIRSIYNELDYFLIHIDMGASVEYAALIRERTQALPNIKIISTRQCAWGGFSLVEATIDLMRMGLADERNDWSHFILLSGTHLPCWPRSTLRQWLTEGKSIISWSEYPQPMDRPDETWAGAIWDRINWNYKEVPGRGMVRLEKADRLGFLYGVGSQWIALSKRHCEFVLSSTNDRISCRLAVSSVADEAYFQTIMLNSDYVNECDRNKRTTQVFWEPGKKNPRSLTLDDYESIAQSCQSPFIRKFPDDLGKEEQVDAALQRVVGPLHPLVSYCRQ